MSDGPDDGDRAYDLAKDEGLVKTTHSRFLCFGCAPGSVAEYWGPAVRRGACCGCHRMTWGRMVVVPPDCA